MGWGAFILPTDWLAGGGTMGALLGFVIGTSLISLIAVSYGLMIELLPVTGGAFAYALKVLGRIPAFGVGWFLALAYACLVALNASAFTLVLRMLAPGIMEAIPMYSVAGEEIFLPSVIAGIVVLLLTGWLNQRGTAVSGKFQFIACVIMAVAVLLVVIAALVTWIRNDFALYEATPTGVPMIAAIMVTLAYAPWAFVGFDNVPQSAGEFNFSPRKAMGLLLGSIAAAGAIYVTMVFATSVAVAHAGGIDEESVWPAASAIGEMVGPIGVILMMIAVTMGVVTGLNGFTASAGRMVMTMSRAKMLPDVFAHVHEKRGTPSAAIAAVIALCLIAPFFGRSALLWIVDMTSVGVTIAYGVTCFIVAKLLSGNLEALPTAMRKARGPLRALAVTGVVLSVAFLGLLFVPGSPAQLSMPPLLALVVWVALGLIVLLTVRRRVMEASEEEIEGVILVE